MELKQLMQILLKRMWIIFIIVFLSTAAAAIYSKYYLTPVYEATNKLIVNKLDIDSAGNATVNASDINTNILLINSYKEIINSETIMSKVLEQNPSLDLTTSDLKSRLQIITMQNSQIVTLKVVDGSYERAVTIVNAIAQVFKEEIPSIMKVNNVTVLDTAKIHDKGVKIGPATKLNMVIAFVLSFLISAGAMILMEYLDDSIRSEFEVRHLLELNTLGVIHKIRRRDVRSRSKKISKEQMGEKYVTANR